MGRKQPEPNPSGSRAESERPAISSRHKRTLTAIFAKPVRSNIAWSDIEALLGALGATKSEGSGSRVRFLLKDRIAVFHRPHPKKETDKGAVESVRRYLIEAGVTP